MSLACVGDNCVDVYRSLGWVSPGGNALNVAIAARRAGIHAAYVGAVGTNDWGLLVLRALTEEGLDKSRVRVVDGPNAYATVDVIDGERVFGPYDVGVSTFSPTEDDRRYLSRFDLIYSGDSSRLEPELALLARCAPLCFDFGERPAEYWEPLIGVVTIACFSAGRLSAETAESLARRAAALGPELVLVTEAARGAFVLEKGELHRSAAAPVRLVDSLGAGDSLTGAFLANLLAGKSAQEALAAGIDAAATTCGFLGAFGYAVAMPADDSWMASGVRAPTRGTGASEVSNMSPEREMGSP